MFSRTASQMISSIWIYMTIVSLKFECFDNSVSDISILCAYIANEIYNIQFTVCAHCFVADILSFLSGILRYIYPYSASLAFGVTRAVIRLTHFHGSNYAWCRYIRTVSQQNIISFQPCCNNDHFWNQCDTQYDAQTYIISFKDMVPSQFTMEFSPICHLSSRHITNKLFIVYKWWKCFWVHIT